MIVFAAFQAVTPQLREPDFVDQLVAFSHALNQIAVHNCSEKVDAVALSTLQVFIKLQLHHSYNQIKNPNKWLPKDFKDILQNTVACSNVIVERKRNVPPSTVMQLATNNSATPEPVSMGNITTNSTGFVALLRRIANKTSSIAKNSVSAIYKGWGTFKSVFSSRRSQSETSEKVNASLPYYSMIIKTPSSHPGHYSGSINIDQERFGVASSLKVFLSSSHFMQILRSLTTIAGEVCTQSYSMNKDHLRFIGELIGKIIQERLRSLEREGVEVKINKKLQHDIKKCSEKLENHKSSNRLSLRKDVS